MGRGSLPEVQSVANKYQVNSMLLSPLVSMSSDG